MEIVSDILPPEATSYLNEIESQASNEAMKADIRKNLDEAHAWGKSFIQKSKEWRKASYETDWAMWQRNSDAKFDPEIAAKKEPWQSKAFIGLTPSHRETIHAQLYKTMVGVRPPLEIKSRFVHNEAMGQVDQSENIRDFILREMEKSKYETQINTVMEQATTYGSGFCRMRYEIKTEDRVSKQPQLEPVNVFDPMSLYRAATGQREVVGYQDVVEAAEVYRGVCFEWLDIWDVFPDPKALEIKGRSIAYRFYQTYGDILDGINKGYNLPEAAEKLKYFQQTQTTPEDKKVVEADRKIVDVAVPTTEYGRQFECYELFAKLPKKWVLINGEPIDDPEKLIACRMIFCEATMISIEPSKEYDGEAPIYKLDYMPVAGRFYARGIPEMLKDSQLIVNEVVNQRLDYGAVANNIHLAVVEKALVNPEADLVSGPRIAIRINSKFADRPIDQIIKQISINDSPVRAGFAEVNEAERWAQERTSANRVTLGTAGQVKDANQTLGGQEMLKASAGEKFAYIGMLMEFGYLQCIFRAYWKTIYANIQPEDVLATLGPERAQTFELLSPEQIDRDYTYTPMGVYTMENKALRQARLQAILQQFQGAGFVNPEAFFDKMLQAADEDPHAFKFSPEEMQQIQAMAAMQTQQMMQQQGQPSAPGDMQGNMPEMSGNMGGNMPPRGPQ